MGNVLPPISVVIPAYGDCPHLSSLLARLDQQLKEQDQIIVVYSNYPDPLPHGVDPNRDILVKSRLLAGAARNRGVAAASNEIIAFLDADVLPDEAYMECVRQFFSVPDVHKAMHGAVAPDPASDSWGEALFFVEFSSVLPGLKSRQPDWGASCCLSLTKKTFELVGGFSEDLLFFEDTLMIETLRTKGVKIGFSQTASVQHVNRKGPAKNLNHAFNNGKHSWRYESVTGRPFWYRILKLAFFSPMKYFATLRRLFEQDTAIRRKPGLTSTYLTMGCICLAFHLGYLFSQISHLYSKGLRRET